MENEQDKLIQEFIESMTTKEHKAYLIAKIQLGSSFQIEKSLGFLKWKRNKQV